MIDDKVKALANGANFAALTTLFSNGAPQTNIMWVDADDEYILINTEIHRVKFKNVSNDPRVSVAIFDSSNPYNYAEVRGRVVSTEGGEAARAHIDKLSEKYTGGPYKTPIMSERVILKITPDRQVVR